MQWHASAVLLTVVVLFVLVHGSARAAKTPSTRAPVTHTPTPAPTCIIRLGFVYPQTGPLAYFEAHAAYATAIGKVNMGDYASGARTAGFALGKGLPLCRYELVERDNESNVTLHGILVAQLIPQVDFFLIGNPFKAYALEAAKLVVDANMISLSCCSASDTTFTLEPNQQFLFGIARPDANIVGPLLHYLNLTPVQPKLAVVYSTLEDENLQACMNVWTLRERLSVVVNFSLVTGDGTYTKVPEQIKTSGATVLVACLELSDALLLAPLVGELHMDGSFYLNGPSFPQFRALPSAMYTFTGVQWAPEMPFVDELFGNSTQFIADMEHYGNFTLPLSDVSSRAAVSVEILTRAIVHAAKDQTGSDVAQLLASVKQRTAAAIQSFTDATLMGPIEFNELHRNVAGTNAVSQILPTSGWASIV